MRTSLVGAAVAAGRMPECWACRPPPAPSTSARTRSSGRSSSSPFLHTDHFEIYYYPEEAGAAQEVGRLAERWYSRLSRIFDHQLTDKQVLVLYASHAEFVQTNVIEGEISEGVGGVTEGARRRIVLPMAVTLADSQHVVGHELVHAFQYDMLGARNAGIMPLWMIEGMAEYLSIGPRDPQTAMWLRDAAYQDHLPGIKNLDDPDYFPYRFGHAFWAYLTGRFGDSIINKVMDEVGLPQGGIGPIEAVEKATGVDRKTLSRSVAEVDPRDVRHRAGRPDGRRSRAGRRHRSAHRTRAVST